MRNSISYLPIVTDRKATIYKGVDCEDDTLFINPDDNVTLCTDGTNVEYWLSFIFDDRRRPFSELQIELNITVKEFLEHTQGDDTFVYLILTSPNKVRVSINTLHVTIYDEVHTIR